MSCCVVIPVYNHGLFVRPAVEAVVAQGLPCYLVDDGSHDNSLEVLKDLEAEFDGVTALAHEVNQGKGGAVMTGIRKAEEDGFVSALQIDADGQHNTEDLSRFVEAAREHPSALVMGKPVFDESIPRHRYYCRYLTHVLVWVQCLSTAIQDSMCGFRVYPVKETLAQDRKKSLPPRMDFDTEVAVRLYWSGVRIVTLETKVQYPEEGLSNFRMFKDNVRLTSMHLRLLGGMLLRIPRLLSYRRRGP